MKMTSLTSKLTLGKCMLPCGLHVLVLIIDPKRFGARHNDTGKATVELEAMNRCLQRSMVQTTTAAKAMTTWNDSTDIDGVVRHNRRVMDIEYDGSRELSVNYYCFDQILSVDGLLGLILSFSSLQVEWRQTGAVTRSASAPPIPSFSIL